MNSFQHADKPYNNKELGVETTLYWSKRRTMPQRPMTTIHESILKRHVLKKRRESTGTAQIQPRPIEIVPRLTKSSTFQTTNVNNSPSWDPHIDALDILRAKLNGITRSMQELQVQASTDSESGTESPIHHRLGPRAHYARAYCFEPLQSGRSRMDIEEEEEERRVASPNLTSIFVTTNSLIHSKLDELSDTTSSSSEREDRSAFEWKHRFLNLITLCIHQSEALESLSVEILNAEQRVQQLKFLNKSIHDGFYEQEKLYENRIRECEQVSEKQLWMIDSLEELSADIDVKLEFTDRNQPSNSDKVFQDSEEKKRQSLVTAPAEEPLTVAERWDFSRAVSDLLNMEEKLDYVHQMRWDVGMFVGGGVGTGHIVHSLEDRLNGIDRMIAGNGAVNNSLHEEREEERETEEEEEEEPNFISPTIRHIKFHQHQYVLHLTDRDKQTRFVLLPKDSWTPDENIDFCQFPACSSRFSLFLRRHHCRKCGQVVCQKHSANQLPLFSSISRFLWCRVCDACFQDLIIMQAK